MREKLTQGYPSLMQLYAPFASKFPIEETLRFRLKKNDTSSAETGPAFRLSAMFVLFFTSAVENAAFAMNGNDLDNRFFPLLLSPELINQGRKTQRKQTASSFLIVVAFESCFSFSFFWH